MTLEIKHMILALVFFVVGYNTATLQEAQATGDEEVVQSVISMLDEALKHAQSGDLDTTISILTDSKKELQDTYQQPKDEEN